MPITFISRTNVVSKEQLEAVHNNLLAASQTYRDRVAYIESVNQNVTVEIGSAFDIGVLSSTTLADSLEKNDIVKIPIEALQGSYYDGIKYETLDRVLAHEIGGHVWQDVNNFRIDNSKPYNFFTNNYMQTQASEDNASDGKSGLNAENIILKEAHNEIPDPVYGSDPVPWGGNIHYYSGNNLVELPNSSNAFTWHALHYYVLTVIAGIKSALNQASPLVLDLNGNGIELTDVTTKPVYWDIDNDGFAETSAWVKPTDGLLAIDLNRNGAIDNNSELFGTSNTDGFKVLAQYDSNQDGKITAEDVVWLNLKVWKDANSDGVSQKSELYTLDQLKITSINLAYTASNTTIAGNNISSTSTFVMNGVTQKIVDAWFKYDDVNTIYKSNMTPINIATHFLPNLRGYGILPALFISMSKDATVTNNLLAQVQVLTNKNFDAIFAGNHNVYEAVRNILFRWAGVDTVSSTSRGWGVDARELGFLEKLTGQPFLQGGYDPNPREDAARDLTQAFNLALNSFYARLVAQAGGKDLFTGTISYNMATDSIDGITGLNQTKLNALVTEAKAMANTATRDVFWQDVVRMVEYTTGTANLTAASKTALINAIKSSDVTLTLDVILDHVRAVPVILTLNGTESADSLFGGVKDDALHGNGGNDTLLGAAGNDSLDGATGDDKLTGGAGNDYLQGGVGNDIYYYNSGDGYDTIREDTGTDKIIFGTGLTAANITFTRVGQQDVLLNIMVNGVKTGDILLKDQFANGGIETLQFADGSTVNMLTKNWTLNGTAGNDTLGGVQTGGGNIDTIYGKDGDDQIFGYAGNDKLYGDNGNDTVLGGDGDDLLYGGAGNDLLNGDNGNDTLYGEAGNDTVNGGAGNDKYYYLSGKDIFTESSGTDNIYLPAGFTKAATAYYKFSNDLQIFFNLDNNITIKNFFAGGGNVIETLTFSDNSTVNLSAISYIVQGDANANTLNGSANTDYLWGMDNNDSINGNAGNDVMFGGNGNDALSGGDGDDKLYGEVGDDTLTGGLGNDWLEGGAGNDTLRGEGGSDTYVYTSGKDNFSDGGAAADIDTIQMATGWNPTDVTFARYITSPWDMLLQITPANSITLVNQFFGQGYGMDTLKFANGTTIDLNTVQFTTYGTAGDDSFGGINSGASQNEIIYGLAGNDYINGGGGNDKIYGGDGNDTLEGGEWNNTLYGENGDDKLTAGTGNDYLDGGAGNDTLVGGTGNDTYYFSAGKDIIYDGYGTDVIQLSSAWNLSNLTFHHYITSNSYLVIDMNATNSITIVDHFYYNGAQTIESLKFSDGSTFNLTTAKIETIGTENGEYISGMTQFAHPDDTIKGMGGDDRIEGLNGNDKLYGGNGNDTLLGGDGNDLLYGQAGADRLVGGAGADTFVFEKTTAFSGVDVIQDFNKAEGDKINIADLFSVHPTAATIDNYVTLKSVDGLLSLMVDRDGTGTAYAPQQVATFENTTGLNIHDLLASNHLVV